MLVNRNKKIVPRISVVIPCFNAKTTISKTLDAVCDQQVSFPFEVIVIDSSNDGTDQVIRTRYKQVQLHHLNEQTLPGSGRNLGIMHVRGEIVVFTDSDCVPDPDWLYRIAMQYQSRNLDCVGGSVVNGYPKNLIAWASHIIEFSEWTPDAPEGFVRNIPSCNISYKKEVFSKYKIHFTDTFPSEDTLFNWTFIQKGGSIYFDPKIRVVHLSRVGLKKLFGHQRKLGKSSAEVRRLSNMPGKIFVKHPALCVLLPGIRWFRASCRLLRQNFKILILFWMITPLYMAAAFAWTIGFLSKGDFSEPKYVIDDTVSN
jgi:glycosyltransferase involved in cell wall biosynthesis